jgi:hypothetical protein
MIEDVIMHCLVRTVAHLREQRQVWHNGGMMISRGKSKKISPTLSLRIETLNCVCMHFVLFFVCCRGQPERTEPSHVYQSGSPILWVDTPWHIFPGCVYVHAYISWGSQHWWTSHSRLSSSDQQQTCDSSGEQRTSQQLWHARGWWVLVSWHRSEANQVGCPGCLIVI